MPRLNTYLASTFKRRQSWWMVKWGSWSRGWVKFSHNYCITMLPKESPPSLKPFTSWEAASPSLFAFFFKSWRRIWVQIERITVASFPHWTALFFPLWQSAVNMWIFCFVCFFLVSRGLSKAQECRDRILVIGCFSVSVGLQRPILVEPWQMVP